MTLAAHTTHLTEGPHGPVTDLTLFIAPEPSPGTRGRSNVWPDRFSQMLDQVPGQWIDATAAWGLKKSAATSIRNNAKRLELDVDVRNSGDRVFVRIR